MTSYESELVIDFGEVGNRFGRHPFRIRLKAEALRALIEHATAAHRIYEMLLIERPGDVWAYVSVVIEQAPREVFERIAHHRSTAARGRALAASDADLSFQEFDSSSTGWVMTLSPRQKLG